MSAYPARNFTVVANELPDPPYPADLKANGWSPAQDIDRIVTSDTWVLAEEDERPWLLRIWLEAWRSVPVGSMPADRRMFARRIGCNVAFLEAHAEILMRGWVLHTDGSLYHTFIITQVQAMLATRSKNREKIKEWRKAQAEKAKCNQLQGECNQLLTGKLPVSNLHGQDRTGQELKEEAKASLSPKPDGLSDEAESPGPENEEEARSADYCPHQAIIDLYHETIPELPPVIPSRWRGSRSETYLRARWREDERHRSLDFWRRLFGAVRGCPQWMGENGIDWKADLHWIIKRENFDKVLKRLVCGG